MSKKPLLSVIIPCFNAQKYIGRCLESIWKSKFAHYEVIVVDDGPRDKSIEEIQNSRLFGGQAYLIGKQAKLKIIQNQKNLGPAISRNIGAKNSLGKYLLFLDADTEVEKNCLEAVVDALAKDKKTGAVQAKLIKGKSDKIEALGHFLTPFGFPYEIGVDEKEEKHKKKRLIFGARSAGMGVKREVFQKIGGFDKDYFIYGEDTDLSWRIWLAGWRIYSLPQAKVYHFQKSSLTPQTRYRLFYQGAKNNMSNILKNAPPKILLWMLPLHILGWILLSLKLIFQKRLDSALWIYKGLGWNLKNIIRTLRKRREVASYTTKNNEGTKIMFGLLRWSTLFLKGWRWFKNV